MSMETTRNGGTYHVGTKISLGSLVSVLALAAAGVGVWADTRVAISDTRSAVEVQRVGGSKRLADHMATYKANRADDLASRRLEHDELRRRLAVLEACMRSPKRCAL